MIRRVVSAACFFYLALTATGGQAAIAASPLAVLKSAKNAESYQSQNLGSYDEGWQSFRRTLDTASLRYDILGDKEINSSRLSQYKVLVLPLFLDISPESALVLQNFLKAGGKLLITDSGGMPSDNAATVNLLAGAKISGHTTIQEAEQLAWPRGRDSLNQDFAVGTLVADLAPSDPTNAVASWKDQSGKPAGAAICRSNGNTFVGWAPGLQGETTTNAQILGMILEDTSPGLNKLSTVQMSDKEYVKNQQELDSLQKRTEDAIATARQADLTVPIKIIQKHYESALSHARSFKDYYANRQFFEADGELSTARNELSLAYAQAMPVRVVEARSVWLDRGTIVACQNEKGLSDLFDRLHQTGINVVYFETNNAGFTMFPSKISTQNPQTASWNPLATAVKEAHKRGIEIHAWFWVFNVGNTFHNPIISQDPDYPGPVLSKHDFSWALSSGNGSLIPPKQHEFWLDPSNPDARKFIKDLVTEIASNYDLDGIQLDYIRYPFNGKGGEMGFDWAGRQRFERETGLCLDRLDDKTRKEWQNWKTRQISTIVEDLSSTIRGIKPSYRISAAVYALPRVQRLASIQQDWETWVAKGWIDTLNPMTYVTKGAELNTMAGYVRQSTENKALVYPGLFIKDLDTAGFIEQLDISRSLGALGNTMFAVAQLDENKTSLLKMGPYRRAPLMTPQADPIAAVKLIFDNFARAVGRYATDPERPIVSDRASTNEVLCRIETIQRQLHSMPTNAGGEQITAMSNTINELNSTVADWLATDTFAKRTPRALYITSYLDQARAILSYAAHHSKTKAASLAARGSKPGRQN